eukprot:c10550_g1_i1 orf=2-151(-)
MNKLIRQAANMSSQVHQHSRLETLENPTAYLLKTGLCQPKVSKASQKQRH